MEDLAKLLGSDLGFSVAHFLSTHGEGTFKAISRDFRCRFPPEVRVSVAVAIAYVLRRRPQSTTSSARIIGIYVLYDAFHFERPIWQHVFGAVFVILLRNEPLSGSNGLQPLGEAERIFLLHLLAVSAEALAQRSPRELLTNPERMVERINAEKYQEQVTCFAIQTLDVRPSAMYENGALYALVQRFMALPLPTESVNNVHAKSDDQQNRGASDEVILHFPKQFVFSDVPMDIFNGDEVYENGFRVAEENSLLTQLPRLAKCEQRSSLPHRQPTQIPSSRPAADWRSASGSASTAPCPVTPPGFTWLSPTTSPWLRHSLGNSASFIRPTVPMPAKPEVVGPANYVGARQVWWRTSDLLNPNPGRVFLTPILYSYAVHNPPVGTNSANQSSFYHSAYKTPSNWANRSNQYRTTTGTVINKSRDGSLANSETKSSGFSQSSLCEKPAKDKREAKICSPVIGNSTSSQKLYALTDSDEEYFERLDREYSLKSPYNFRSLASAAVERPTSSFASKGCCTSEGDGRENRYATSDSASASKNGKAADPTSPSGDSESESDSMTSLVRRATVVTLAMARQQRLLQLFEKRTDDGLISAVDEDVFERLINLNPLLAVYIFCRLVSAGRAQKYYQRVLDMDVSVNVLDVVNRVVTAMFMPVDFLCSFLCKCYSTYVSVPTNDRSPYKRIVTLIISFTDSLFQRRMIDPKCIRCEALHFCISHSNLSQALALYRKLKSQEHA